MSKVLIFTLSMVLAGLMAGCATHTKSGLSAVRTGIRRIEKVRTTAYTHTEGGGRHNILEWGSDERSLYVLAPRARNRLVRRMILALQEKARAHSPLLNF